jgi:hypothetical protein
MKGTRNSGGAFDANGLMLGIVSYGARDLDMDMPLHSLVLDISIAIIQ